MFKRIYVILLMVATLSFSSQNANKATLAYDSFLTGGLGGNLLDLPAFDRYAHGPSTIYYNGTFHQFYCSNSLTSDSHFNFKDVDNIYNSLDYIRYRTSKDGTNWSAPRVVMAVNENHDGNGACDPSVVYGDDGYWYMLYDGVEEGSVEKGVVVYMARSHFIQGPYFKYTEDGWENEISSSSKTKIMLEEDKDYMDNDVRRYNKLLEDAGLPSGVLPLVGQQTIVKMPEGGDFYVWYRTTLNNVKLIQTKDLKNLKNDSRAKDAKVCLQKTEESCYVFSELPLALHSLEYVLVNGERNTTFYDKGLRTVSIGDVRYNASVNRWEMWCAHGYNDVNIRIMKFVSENGLSWQIEDADVVGPYSFIHNIGVSGDAFGRIWDDKYLISFSGYKISDDADVSLHATAKELKDKGCDLGKMTADRPLVCESPMWQQLVGGKWSSEVMEIPALGIKFPHNVESEDIDYFTGDYDGDGITDLGAVNREDNKWYIYSIRNGYIIDGDELFPAEYAGLDYEVISGDYNGDGKTDVGVVDKANGTWFIYSSKNGEPGIGSSKDPDWIPWGWQLNGMGADHKILVGDYNGDGVADRAIYNPPYWYIISSLATESTVADGFFTVYGGVQSFIPWGWSWQGLDDSFAAISGDFDGDGITDRAVYGKNDGKWYSLSSRKGEDILVWRWNSSITDGVEGDPYSQRWRWNESKEIWGFNPFEFSEKQELFAGDYDGDGVDDLVQVIASEGKWSVYRSLDGETESVTWKNLKNTEKPVVLVGDFDGDGKADRAFVDKKTHVFCVKSSRTGEDGVHYVHEYVSKDLVTGYFTAENFDEESPKNTSNPEAALDPESTPEPKPAPDSETIAVTKTPALNDSDDEQKTLAIPVVAEAPSMDVSVVGQTISVSNVENGSKVFVFNMLGKKVFSAIVNGGSVSFELPSRGKFVVRAGAQSRSVMVK